jgi:starch synthase
MPGYRAVLEAAGDVVTAGRIEAFAGLPACDIARIERPDGLTIYLLLCPELFDRDGSPYVRSDGEPWSDNARRFATLSHAAAEIAAGRAGMAWRPHLVHLNDWPCALAAAYMAWRGVATPTLMTIHNLAYQGLFPTALAGELGIPAEGLPDIDFHGQLSFLRAGIVHATCINTVSVSYARQITQPQMGCGLDPLLAMRAAQGRLSGIVNGIDESWDPGRDRHLDCHFTIGDCHGKRINAMEVRRLFGLHRAEGPLFAVVSRLVQQKGLDLICEVAPQIVAAGGQIVIIGEGEPAVLDIVRQLANRFPGHVGAHVGFSETLARRMFAGSDFLLMPSRFEPCGLSQMYAQRFGSLPIAHATGGLIDTVEDGVTGFLFREPTADSLRRCVQRAFGVYRAPQLLDAMRRAAMLRPCGWDAASRNYVALYDSTASVGMVA